jgi:retinol-binding protein 3
MKKLVHLIIVALVFVSVSRSFSQEKTSTFLNDRQISVLVDSLSKSLKTYYTYPDKATNMAEYLKAQLKRGAYKKYKDPTALAYQLESDVRHIYHDAHMHIVFEPGLRPPKELSLVERKDAYKEQLAAEKENNFNLKKVEILPGNIGYFRFDGFTGFIEEAKSTVTAALTFLLNTKALIIDLRFNGGGSTINQFPSYFFKQKTHLYDQVSTINKDTLVLYTDPSSTNSLALLMPIYILTSKNTASAAEAFASSMQALNRAVIIGDTTQGASHVTGFFL